jgi:ketosteroid isomerase-like protein
MSDVASFDDALERIHGAQAEMRNGNPEPFITCLAESEDATLFGAWGPIEKGYSRLAETFRWVASRFSGGGGRLIVEDAVRYASGDLAYTVGFERGEVTVDGGAKRPMVIRVTHIYRRYGEEWKLIHRHADFPPEDPRKAPQQPSQG